MSVLNPENFVVNSGMKWVETGRLVKLSNFALKNVPDGCEKT